MTMNQEDSARGTDGDRLAELTGPIGGDFDAGAPSSRRAARSLSRSLCAHSTSTMECPPPLPGPLPGGPATRFNRNESVI